MNPTDGGAVVPNEFARWTEDGMYLRALAVALGIMPAPTLTRQQRIVRWVRTRPIMVKAWLHDRLFGSDYCDHDACY